MHNNWKGIKMKMMTRRKFIGLVVGGLTAVKVGLGKSKQKYVKFPIDDQPVLEFPKGAWHREGEPDFPQNLCKRKEYNIIDDLIGEIYRYEEFHNQHFQYCIHCNCSGLAWLNRSGKLSGNHHKLDRDNCYRHLLWIQIPLNFDFFSCDVGVKVQMQDLQKSDIILYAHHKVVDKCGHYWNVITSRCFNIDLTKEGRVLMDKEYNREDMLNA